MCKRRLAVIAASVLLAAPGSAQSVKAYEARVESLAAPLRPILDQRRMPAAPRPTILLDSVTVGPFHATAPAGISALTREVLTVADRSISARFGTAANRLARYRYEFRGGGSSGVSI